VVCLSNQRQLGLALHTYAEEFRGWHPREARMNTDVSWPRAFRPLLDPKASWVGSMRDQYKHAPYYRDPARVDDGHNIHYVNNGVQFSGPGEYGGMKPATRMDVYPSPSMTLYLSCYADDSTGTYRRQAYGSGSTSNAWVSLLYDLWEFEHINGPEPELRLAPRRHGDGANGMFVDGHARHVGGADLQDPETWNDHDYRVRAHAR
jgi:prepilin-type processing-associated H-X9-DG protein